MKLGFGSFEALPSGARSRPTALETYKEVLSVVAKAEIMCPWKTADSALIVARNGDIRWVIDKVAYSEWAVEVYLTDAPFADAWIEEERRQYEHLYGARSFGEAEREQVIAQLTEDDTATMQRYDLSDRDVVDFRSRVIPGVSRNLYHAEKYALIIGAAVIRSPAWTAFLRNPGEVPECPTFAVRPRKPARDKLRGGWRRS